MYSFIDNVSLSGDKFLDNRERFSSYEELCNNTTIIMPIGFKVYCVVENKWYQLSSATDIVNPETYVWEEDSTMTKETEDIDFSTIFDDTEGIDNE